MENWTAIIGVNEGTSPYTETDINDLLQVEQTALSHGDTFTGRPGTTIHINEHTVLKIRNELRFNEDSAKKWTEHALKQEQARQIYHPQKTWFITTHAVSDTGFVTVGNICPRLKPLHELLANEAIPTSQRLDFLEQLFNIYFYAVKHLDIRLDEGLSNFGATTEGKVYYLDDDVYTWDRFISCGHMLGVYFRSSPWLDVDIAAMLGKIIRKLIVEYFDDTQYLMVLTEQLRDVFMPANFQPQLESFIQNVQMQKQTAAMDSAKNHIFQARYLAILGDVHANLPAVDVVLNFLKLHDVKQGIIVGDIVGYGPHPSQCIERIQATNFLTIKGNHDHGLATGNFYKGFSNNAAWVLQWSLSRVTAEQRAWLGELPPILHHEDWLVLHGAPVDPTFFNAYVYEMTYRSNLDLLQRKEIPLCFHGHTHQPGVYARRGVVDNHFTDKVVELASLHHALICPGSVGQPRNKQPGAQFAIFDTKEKTLHYHNLAYDLTAILKQMQEEGFPASLMGMLQGN